tara:strand:+ start:314 stop:793 length:480 start_codon:yes stop_codon:yes gene_type:complete
MGSPKGAEAGTGIISLFLEEFKRMSPKRRRNWEIPKKTPAVHFPLSQGDWLCYAFRFIGSILLHEGEIMVTALVMLNIDRPQIASVAQGLVDMPEVSEVYSVAGRYDLVAIVRVKTNEEIASTITGKFAELVGITGTETLIAFHTYSRHDLEHMFSLGN